MLHQLVQENLEDYISGRGNPERRSEVRQHLSGCRDCREVVEAMQLQARWVQALRPPADVLPSAGFYARVMERIEAQAPISFWSFFLDPLIGKRLVLASLTLLALLSAVAVSTEGNSTVTSSDPVEIMAKYEYAPTPGIDQQQDRDVVLVNLATWRSSGVSPEPAVLQSDSQ